MPLAGKDNKEYVDTKKIKWSGSKVEMSDPLPQKAVSSTTLVPKKSAMKKTNRLLFGGPTLNVNENDEEKEYPGMHVKRRSEKYGSNSSLLHTMRAKSFKKGEHNRYSITCMDRILLRFIFPKKAFLYACEGVNQFMMALDNEWSPILKLFEWPKLPGGQHLKTRGYNYVTHSIWILAYAAGTASSGDDDKEDYYRDCFEDLLLNAELVGIDLKDFVKPLNVLKNMFHPFADMATIMNVDVSTPAYFGADADEIFGEAIIPETKRYKTREYVKLKIYSRDVHDIEWIEFRELRFRDQMIRIRDGLTDIVIGLNTILETMPSVLKVLSNADSKRRKSQLPILLPHIVSMRNNLTKLFQAAKVSSDDEGMIKVAFEKAQENMQYTIEQAIFVTINIWEVVLMSRVAYKYVESTPNSSGSLIPTDELYKRLPNADERLSPTVEYKWKQFYDVSCAALLRKVPTIIGKNVEIAIHMDGFVNPVAEKSTKKSLFRARPPSKVNVQVASKT